MTNYSNDKVKYDFFNYISTANKEKLQEVLNNKSFDAINATDIDGNTALRKAIKQENYDIILIILNNIKNNLTDLEFVKYMNNQSTGISLIHEVALLGNLEILQLLMDFGTDINTETEMGLNCLHIACQEDQLRFIIYLIEKLNFDPNKKDKKNSLPLHWASYYGSEHCAKYLISKTNNINALDYEGHSFLHLSVLSRNLKLIKNLIYSGVDINIKDNKGLTCIDYCKEKKYDDELKIFEELNQSCNTCTVNPTQAHKKSNFNIYLFFCFHLLIEFLLFAYILPHYNSYISFIVSSLSLITLMTIYILLIIVEPNDKYEESKLKINLLTLVEKKKPINNICYKCRMKYDIYNRLSTTHCIICDKCIMEFNHHCFWANKCIGKNNVKLFYSFLLSLAGNFTLLAIISFGIIHSKIFSQNLLYLISDSLREGIESKQIVILISYFICSLSLLCLIPIIFLIVVHIKNEIAIRERERYNIGYNNILNDTSKDDGLKQYLIDSVENI